MSFITYPVLVFGSVSLRLAIIPAYRFYLKIKGSVAGTSIIRFRPFRFRLVVIRHFASAVLTLGVVCVVVNNLLTHRLYAEEMGSGTILFSLIREEQDLEEEGVLAFVAQRDQDGVLSELTLEEGFERGADQISGLAFDGEGSLMSPSSDGGPEVRTREGIETYAALDGDTISSIAYQFGISVNTILWANNLTVRSILQPGKQLIILPVSGIYYTVQRGDTIGGLAKRYDISEDEIRGVNKLSEVSVLARGEKIMLSGARPLGAPRTTSAASSSMGSFALRRTTKTGFLWPAPGQRINQYFSWRHSGLDVDNITANDPIYASESGTVTIAGWNRGGYGNRVLIQHGGGIQTNYGHLKKVLAKQGQKVQKGDVIGIMGTTGRSTGIHLHFEVIVNGRRVNPLSYLQ